MKEILRTGTLYKEPLIISGAATLVTEIFQIAARIAVNSGAIDKIRNKELEGFRHQGRVPRINQRFLWL
ncbi:MAG: hypothetical protein JKY90_01975 [Gammaproteobacteria bacterium]|nr:hypothetical protein [Gammaproteobacteria bacterium]